MLQLFLLILAAHLCGDLLIYSPGLAQNKRSGSWGRRSWYILRHVLIHALFVWIWLWTYSLELKVLASLYIFVVHYLIDISRTYYEPALIAKQDFHIFSRKDLLAWLTGRSVPDETQVFLKKHLRTWLGINLLDQSLHLISIFVFVLLWS